VFFSASRTARKSFGGIYQRVVTLLEAKSFEVFDDTVVVDANPLKVSDKTKKDLYKKTIKEMDRSDILVFEASWPSTIYVGFKIMLAFGKGKPVIVLYKEGSGFDPHWYEGVETRNALWVAYTEKNLEEKLLLAVEKANKMVDIRFNLFIPRKLMAYLDWIVREVGINKSEYIRNLIEKEIIKSK